MRLAAIGAMVLAFGLLALPVRTAADPEVRGRGDGPPPPRRWERALPESNRAARRDWSITRKLRPGAKARRR
jgi:hypothetical protein